MARPVNFSQKSAKRIASAVRKVEGTARVPFIAQRRRGQILSSSTTTLFGKLDADLAYNSTTGVTVSIWALNESKAWADTTENETGVLPPPWLTAGKIASGEWVEFAKDAIGNWHVTAIFLPLGTATNDILRWDNTNKKWVKFAAPSTSGTFFLTVVNGTMTWTAAGTGTCE